MSGEKEIASPIVLFYHVWGYMGATERPENLLEKFD